MEKQITIKENNPLKSLLLVFASVILTATTLVFGAVMLRALKLGTSKLTYWFICFFTSMVLLLSKSYILGIMFMVIAFLIGLFSFFQENGYSLERASFVSLFSSSLILCGSYLLMNYQTSQNFIAPFKEKLTLMLGQSAVQKDVNIAKLVDDLIKQVPSGLVMSLMIALVLSLVIEAKFKHWFKTPTNMKYKLEFFKLPDEFIWAFIVTLFGSFYAYDEAGSYLWVKTVSVNLFNIVLLFYFFQGLSIIYYYFKLYNVSPFWRMLLTIMFIFQLFVVVCALGITDFWFNYRLRLAQKAARTKNKEIEE